MNNQVNNKLLAGIKHALKLSEAELEQLRKDGHQENSMNIEAEILNVSYFKQLIKEAETA